MGRRRISGTAVLTLVAALTTLLVASVPAIAHHKDGHAQGPAASADGDGSKGKPAKNEGSKSRASDDVADEGDNAHPSGKDRSVEKGGSGNQGNSESDPDDDGRGPDRSNGGPDKPDGSGGVDKADQDGNNGCGNDDDFEDDNEGWCGRKRKPAKPEVKAAAAKPCDADATMPGTQPCLDGGVLPAEPCVDDASMGAGGEPCQEEGGVLGDVVTRPATPEQDVEEGPEVLGERLSQPVEGVGVVEVAQRGAAFLGRQLPFTGSALLSYAAIAVGLLLAGAGILASRRRV